MFSAVWIMENSKITLFKLCLHFICHQTLIISINWCNTPEKSSQRHEHGYIGHYATWVWNYWAHEVIMALTHAWKLFLESSVSIKHSRNIIPSVMYFIFVSGDVQSSNRIVYPTSAPSFTGIIPLMYFINTTAALRILSQFSWTLYGIAIFNYLLVKHLSYQRKYQATFPRIQWISRCIP